jgi:NAD-dependent deacetylase
MSDYKAEFPTDAALEQVAEALRDLGPTGRAAALTGAGVSVPSGIPDFRSAGGIWDRYPPEDYSTIDAFRRDPGRVWEFLAELASVVAAAQPNPAHEALAGLESRGYLTAVVTQNVDSLHQRGGSKSVVEYHGAGSRLVCLQCQARRTAEGVSLRPEDLPPRCPGCGGVEKPDVVLFGEMIPAGVLEETTRLIDHCEVWIVAGTSAQVQPAALVPFHARLRGAKVFEFNLEPLLDQAHGRVLGDVAETLPALLKML